MSEHHDRIEEIQSLIALVANTKGEPTHVTVAWDNCTLGEVVICDNDNERNEVLAVLRRELKRIMH